MSGRARGRALRTQSVPPGASASVPEGPARSDIGRFNQGPTLAEAFYYFSILVNCWESFSC